MNETQVTVYSAPWCPHCRRVKKFLSAHRVRYETIDIEEDPREIESLRQLLARASIELSELHADEAALAKKRSRVLSDVCALLAKATGESGQAPPPIPATALERRLTVAPAVDISEVAELIESLRPPAAPKVD